MGFVLRHILTALTRVGICNPDSNVMSTDQSPAVAQNVTDGITNPVRRSGIGGTQPYSAACIAIRRNTRVRYCALRADAGRDFKSRPVELASFVSVSFDAPNFAPSAMRIFAASSLAPETAGLLPQPPRN